MAEHEPDTELTADEVEQRQRPDGSVGDEVDATDEGPLSADEVEQRQRPDGTLEGRTTVEETSSDPLTPDELDQRRRISEDDEDQRDQEGRRTT